MTALGGPMTVGVAWKMSPNALPARLVKGRNDESGMPSVVADPMAKFSARRLQESFVRNSVLFKFGHELAVIESASGVSAVIALEMSVGAVIVPESVPRPSAFGLNGRIVAVESVTPATVVGSITENC